MTVESATKISQLNPAWPLGSDPKSEGDNHLRLIKDVVQKDALSLADGGTVNSAVTFKSTVRVNSGNGTIVQRNTAIAANIGIWSTDILGSNGSYQITPRGSDESVIAGAGGFQLSRNAAGIVDCLLTGNNVSGQAPSAASVMTRQRSDNRYVLKTALTALEAALAQALMRIEELEARR